MSIFRQKINLAGMNFIFFLFFRQKFSANTCLGHLCTYKQAYSVTWAESQAHNVFNIEAGFSTLLALECISEMTDFKADGDN